MYHDTSADWKRPPGRPSQTWLTVTCDDLHRLDICTMDTVPQLL